MDADSVKDKCQRKLIEVAKVRGTINYADLAKYLGVANQAVGKYLNAIYEELAVGAGRPDLTLLAVSASTGVGRFNSQGQSAQTTRVDPNNEKDRETYKRELEKVYQENWSE